MVKLGAFRPAVREPTVSKPYLKEHQEYNLQAMHGGKGEFFFFNGLKEEDSHCKFF